MDLRRVLVVDPDDVCRLIALQTILGEYDVTAVSSSREAIDFVKSKTVDIVLINVTLAYSMECIPLLETLRKLASPSTFVAVATSSHIDEPRLFKLIEAGFQNVIMKPISIEKMNRSVRRLPLKETPLLSINHAFLFPQLFQIR